MGKLLAKWVLPPPMGALIESGSPAVNLKTADFRLKFRDLF